MGRSFLTFILVAFEGFWDRVRGWFVGNKQGDAQDPYSHLFKDGELVLGPGTIPPQGRESSDVSL